MVDSLARRIYRRLHVSLVRKFPSVVYPDWADFQDRIWPRVRGYTMTSLERAHALHQGVKYVVNNAIPGAFVECGVWRGGSSMIAALTFLQSGDIRDLYLFDTFAGMTEPTARDISRTSGDPAERTFRKRKREGYTDWCFASVDEVMANLASTGYPPERLHLIQGDVAATLSQVHTGPVSVLRLDTDFYESTRLELEVLYPRLGMGGVLLIDDYGHWQGAREAVDEYFDAHGGRPLLTRLDHTGVLGVKVIGS